MKVIYDKNATKQLMAKTKIHNLEAQKRRLLLALTLAIAASIAIPMLGETSGKWRESVTLVALVFGILIPSIFRDFVPGFKPTSIMRPDFVYSALSEKAKEVSIAVDRVKKKTCRLWLKAELGDGFTFENSFVVQVVSKENVEDIVVDLRNNTVFIPTKKQ